mmetsp:Transcript_27210/g.61733  ORF Transcript_27210/g.61733 Transcript_27210/m.61733 type:complete len:205 (-) Transcript_27210:122-736(-)
MGRCASPVVPSSPASAGYGDKVARAAPMSGAAPEPVVGDVCPKRFGLNYDPPSIVLEYLQVSTGKLFHRRIGLRKLRANSDPARVAEKLRQKNKALLAEDRVSFEQIVSLVTRLQEGVPGNVKNIQGNIQSKMGSNNQSIPAVDYHEVNLNKLSTEEITAHKEKMDVMFFQNQKKPGDADYQYDKQVDFEEGTEECGWDSEDDD